MRPWLTRVAMFAVVAQTIGCDQVSKHVAAEHLLGAAPRSYLGDSLRLEYAENSGAFLSLGANLPSSARTAIFVVGTGALLLGCGVAAIRQRGPTLGLLGLALVFGGGVSNLFDRIAHGAVIDFLNVGVGSLRTGIFNVADMAIMLGVALILFAPNRRTDATDPAR